MPSFGVIDYDDSNRAFLQAFMARSVMTLETAKPILAAIFSIHEGREILPNDVNTEDLESYISAANSKLSPLDLEIRRTVHQQTRDRYYALVNTTSDALTQLATTYTAEEIAYVKRLLDAMFEGPNNRGKREAMCIRGMDAVQLHKPGARRETQNSASQASSQGLTLREAVAMLGKLVEGGWLEKSVKGFYSLSPRALMELRGWLVETYNDPNDDDDDAEDDAERTENIRFCHACKKIITVGQRCAQPECKGRLHDICTVNFFRMHKSQSCPLCNTAWDGKSYVGEKAITTSEAYMRGKRRSVNTKSAASSETNENEEEDED